MQGLDSRGNRMLLAVSGEAENRRPVESVQGAPYRTPPHLYTF